MTYHWRRDNLVTEVHVHCYGDCPDADAAVDVAARAWADAIDEQATRLMTKNASRYGEGERVVARVRAAGRYLLRVANHAGAESPGSYAVAVTMQRSH